MRRSPAPSPAERLLAEIYEAGYSSVDDFIDRLRIPARTAPAGRHAAMVDPFSDTIELYLDPIAPANPLAGVSHWYPQAGVPEVDPAADTMELPALAHIWVIPERHAS
ncbi:hypothetical protein [Nocardia nova]|uniref:hypothetical protein n=1 Tax=Nocardia nova TaxID=37330 RepID=UPI0033F5E4E4